MSRESDELRDFARRKFGSQAGLARALGITPQSLNPYFNGRKGIGEDLADRLAALGFQAQAYAGLAPALDLAGLETILERSIEAVAPTIGVPAEIAAGWRRGEAIQADHLVRITNLLVAVALPRLALEARRGFLEAAEQHQANV